MLKELGLEKRRLRAILPMSISTWKKGAKMDSGSGAHGQDRRQRAEIGTQEVFRRHLLYCAGGWALAYVAHVTLKVSKTAWTRPWEAVLVKYAREGRQIFWPPVVLSNLCYSVIPWFFSFHKICIMLQNKAEMSKLSSSQHYSFKQNTWCVRTYSVN